MSIEWRKDPPEIPLKLIAHEDFVQEIAFSGPVNSFPTGTTINFVIYPDANVESTAIATWPATVNLAESTGAWSVDYTLVDAIELPAFYRVRLSVPNASDIANPTIERCLVLGKLTRK